MTQLSRPFQIALVALALFVLVWFAALHRSTSNSSGGSGSSPAASSAPAKPSAASEAKAAAAPTHIYHGAAPGVEGLTRAIDKAHGAVAQSQSDAHRAETSDPSASSSSSSSSSSPSSSASSTTVNTSAASARAPAHPAAAAPTHARAAAPAVRHPAVKHPAAKANMQAAVEHELRQGKTVLILFWNRHGSDDIAVHSALPTVQRALGARVAVHYAAARQVGAFGTVTHAIQVTQTPTLLIVNPHGQTTVLTGLNDAFAIRQAVAEARHS
jgi:hypothetical protein